MNTIVLVVTETGRYILSDFQPMSHWLSKPNACCLSQCCVLLRFEECCSLLERGVLLMPSCPVLDCCKSHTLLAAAVPHLCPRMGHYCRLWIQLALQIHPQALLLNQHPQLNLSYFSVPLFFHHEYLSMSEPSKGQFSIFLEPVCWILYRSDVTTSILWEPRAALP